MMESLAALGLAAAVVQFVDFTKKLLLDTRDIYRSGKGALDDNLQLEQICEVLKRLSGEITAEQNALATERESEYHLVPKEDALGLKNLASSCKNDCNELLSIVQSLSVDGGSNRRWRSIKASVRNFQHKGQIKNLEDRIMKAQNTMALHIQSVIRFVYPISHSVFDAHFSRDQVASLSKIALSLKQKSETLELSQDEELDRITRDIHYLKICRDQDTFSLTDIKQTTDRLSKCLPLQDEVARFQRILSTLQFDTRPVRHDSIPEAHVSTFKWIFESRFSKWLRDGDGIFWITGKPGSGKSTLMKFIADHEISNKIANEWAAPKPVVIACHYFWNPGTEMQRSQQGLLRTLLFDIFRQCPTLLPLVCPKRWEMAHTVDSDYDTVWTIPELSACLQEIADQNDSTVRFCLFIDGLDEFSGDCVDLCQALQSLSKSRHIKLSVSSRPWNVFQDFFGQNPSTTLSIHELTWEDIRRFAQSRLEIHPRWETCSISDEDQHQLIHEIADKAEGVFLWAFLVTRSLREGLSNDDTMTDLQRRLRSLPTDLERLFRNLLSGVDPVYHEHMAGIIQIARFAKSPLSLCLYYHHDKQSESDDYAYSRVQRLQPDDYFKGLNLTNRRINSKTRGLLEVVTLLGNRPVHIQQSVQFLHRTVRDFLRTREMDDFLSEKSRENFDPALEICKASLAWIKCEGRVKVLDPYANLTDERELHDMLRYATEVTAEREDTLVKVLDNLETTIVEISCGVADTARVPRIAFRRLVLQYNLFRYVSAKLSLNPIHFDIFETDVLFTAVQLRTLYPGRDSSSPSSNEGCCLPVDSIRVLVEHGYNPNKLPSLQPSSTPWSELIHSQFLAWGNNARHFLSSGLLQIFLRHGADPNVNIVGWDGKYEQVSAFALFLLACFDESFIPKSSTTTYLNILQNFLDSGADLDYQMNSNTTLWLFSFSIAKSFTRGSVCEAFSVGLKSRAAQWVEHDEDDQRDRHFLYCVTRKVLSLGLLRNYSMAMITEAIPIVFPEELAEELLSIPPKASGSCNRRKRDEEGSDLGIKNRKRQKRRRSGKQKNCE
ncbi:hypothetical protein CHU98_g7404 [Xylaria longipes]|nr:hypothetical protein CHU98_g7404 [Xylaria longipes]